MGKKICETGEPLPTGGSVRKTVVEPGIDHKALSDWIRRRPEISHRIAVSQWLRKVPELARNGKPANIHV